MAEVLYAGFMDEAPHPVNEHIAEEIRALMGRRRVSQKQLGEFLGYTQGTMSKRLNGSKSWTIDELDAIAGYFSVGLADLLPPLDREGPGEAGGQARNRWSSPADARTGDAASLKLTTTEITQARVA